MNSSKDDKMQRRYRSGEAARLANMPVTTLRIWERRYGVIAPPKSESGQRLYSEDDVRRLVLLKTLVERGHPIGTIAKLPVAQLEQLAQNRADSELVQLAAGAGRPRAEITLTVVGAALVQRLRAENLDLLESGIVNMMTFDDLAEAGASDAHDAADALLVTITSLHDDVAAHILSLGEACQTKAIAVAYAFGTARAIQTLRLAGVRLYREPNSRSELRQILDDLSVAARGLGAAQQPGMWSRAPRRYDDRTLTDLATRSTTIACECPRHLVELIMKLAAFEQYSDECRSRSVEDALLHRHLGDVANRALAMLEASLARVVSEESLADVRRGA